MTDSTQIKILSFKRKRKNIINQKNQKALKVKDWNLDSLVLTIECEKTLKLEPYNTFVKYVECATCMYLV